MGGTDGGVRHDVLQDELRQSHLFQVLQLNTQGGEKGWEGGEGNGVGAMLQRRSEEKLCRDHCSSTIYNLSLN